MVADAWLASLAASGLPIATTDGARPRPKVSFGAPLPATMAADGELIDVVLTERWPIWRVSEAVRGHVPDGWRVADLHDVWLAGPPLAGQVAAADYLISIATPIEIDRLVAAADALMRSDRLVRERMKSGRMVGYDLRPLLLGIRLEQAGPQIVIETRTRIHPELGTGRPEEVLAALGDRLDLTLEAGTIVRRRLILADELVESAPT